MMAQSSSTNKNPCDFFMREMSINYPKTEEDTARLARWINKYQKEQAPLVEREMQELTYGDLN